MSNSVRMVRSPLILISAVLAFAACGSGAPRPDPIRPAEDSCASCRMQISQPKFAAEVLTAEGVYLKFDDIGCFRRYLKENQTLSRAPAWVMDYSTGQWLDARKASYAHGAKEPTPMGSGIVAAATAEAAGKLGSRVLSFDEMMAQKQE